MSMDIPTSLDPICVPINLDAFVLHAKVCDSGATRILPIQQPNYVALRLDNADLQHDVLPTADLHRTQPSSINPRITNAFTRPLKAVDTRDPNPDPTKGDYHILNQNRLGIYLSWSLPRGYRTGRAAAAPAIPPGTTPSADSTNAQQPVFRSVPNRWVIVRVLNGLNGSLIPPQDRLKAFIVESDMLRSADDLPGTIDLETDVTPFVRFDLSSVNASDLLTQQAELFIGRTSPLDSNWVENTDPKSTIDLNIMQSANPYFTDYQYHNASVFSMKDTLQLSDGSYVTSASCDYLVCGYHNDPVTKDPFNQGGLGGTLDKRLEAFFFDISSDLLTKNPEAGQSTAPTSLVFHGVIKGVKYDTSRRPITPADDKANTFTSDVDMEPVSVGTTPLDSVITFLQAHLNDTDFEDKLFSHTESSDTESSHAQPRSTLSGSALASQVIALSDQMYAAEGDSYDSRVKARDFIDAHNFAKGPASGFAWVYDKKKTNGQGPAVPSMVKDTDGMSELDYLARLNELQRRLDAATRALALWRWSLFAQFFNFCSDPDNSNHIDTYRTAVDNFRSLAKGLRQLVETDIPSQINKIILAQVASPNDPTSKDAPPKVPARKVAAAPFYTRSDPTLFLAGLDAGWPPNYRKNVKTRMSSELQTQAVDSDISDAVKRLPATSPRDLITRLLSEAFRNNGTKPNDLTAIGGKIWNGQPFCPIFVEWEAIYYNVSFDGGNWDIALASSPSTNNHKTVRYVNPNKLFEGPLHQDVVADTRTLSGRIPILPQPSFSLSAVVNQVITATPVADLPPDLQAYKDLKARQPFLDNITSLPFISGQMTGVTDGLLTLIGGQHVNPNVRIPGQDLQPMKAAMQVTDPDPKAGRGIGLGRDDYLLIGDESIKTPYGSLVSFPDNGPQPFKGVTHGQLAITKLVVVDKFGQAISAPPPKAMLSTPDPQPEFIHPCLSDQLCPTVLTDPVTNKDYLNTVYHASTDKDQTSSKYPLSPFVQLPPSINQDSRINASFMRKVFDSAGKFAAWQATTEWENPIVGWVVVNYADSAMQIFTGEGIFYTEVRIGGPGATITSPKYLPFTSPSGSEQPYVSKQLDEFVQQMQGTRGVAYMKGLWDMINKGIETMPFPPSDYAAFANAIVGKPLALVNVGWSLELAQPPLQAQQTLGPRPGVNQIPSEADAMGKYAFRVKLGDHERPFDGLLGYYDVGNKDLEEVSTVAPSVAPGTTDWSKLYTYYAPDMAEYGDPDSIITSAGDGDPRQPLIPTAYPKLTPYFLDPSKYDRGPTGYAAMHDSKMMVKMCIIDPYTPVHLYSGILPINSIQLSSWMVQTAFKNMTAFFTTSVILKVDVPKTYNTNAALTPTSWLATQTPSSVPNAVAQVKIPIAGGKGMWNWLQPYPPASDATGDAANTLRYNALDVQNEDGKLSDAPGPFTVVEGFLQLARPLIQSTNQ